MEEAGEYEEGTGAVESGIYILMLFDICFPKWDY